MQQEILRKQNIKAYERATIASLLQNTMKFFDVHYYSIVHKSKENYTNKITVFLKKYNAFFG